MYVCFLFSLVFLFLLCFKINQFLIWKAKILTTYLFPCTEMNETIHENSDTVGQIVNYIMKNEGIVL